MTDTLQRIDWSDLGKLAGQMTYIAGPYRAGYGRTVVENIRAAEKVAWQLARSGVYFFCPHTHTAHMTGIVPDDFWLAHDLAIMHRACDAILMINGWTYSRGAVEELRQAREQGMGLYELKGG